jgi:hypothetical protein
LRVINRYNKKFYKYQDTITKLKELGWEPILHIIILGTLGEIPRQLAVTLTEIGIKSTALEKLQNELHQNAINWMDVCIDTELALYLKNQAVT